MIDLDISDPANPRLDSRTSWSGTSSPCGSTATRSAWSPRPACPQLPFVEPRAGRRTEDEAEKRNREIVRSSTVEDWVPGLDGSEDRVNSPEPVGCDEVYHPKTWSGADTVAVATFRPGGVATPPPSRSPEPGARSTPRPTGSTSPPRTGVTSCRWTFPSPTEPDSSLSDLIQPKRNNRTHIHAFALEDDGTRYLASGAINGTLRDRWSLDEYDGHLRVAVSWNNRDGAARESGIVVLDEQDGRLEQVGELRGLGIDEEIQSVRWFDDLAVVVTFRQVDPLYTIDLSDPTAPRRLGS